MSLLSANLQAFQSVAKTGKVLTSADELHIGQTGVTQRIRSLEKELGVSLFIRSRKGMALTQEGLALLNYCKQATEIEGRTLSVIKDGGQKSFITCTIAGPTSFMASRVLPNCLPLYKKWPMLNLSYHIEDQDNRINLLKTGAVDLIICRPEQVTLEMDSKRLKPDHYVLVGHPDWKGRNLAKIISEERIVDFSEDDPMTLSYLRKYDLQRHLKRPRIYANSNDTLLQLLLSGVAYCVLTKSVAQPLLTNGKIIMLNNGLTMNDEVALAWYPRAEMPNHFQDIVSEIK